METQSAARQMHVQRSYDPKMITKQAKALATEHGYRMKAWRFIASTEGWVKVKVICRDDQGASTGFLWLDI